MMQTPALEAFHIPTQSGPLELIACLPPPPVVQQPLLFVHGAHCSAACFNAILPRIARSGYACYAVSLRGHGKSWQPGLVAFHAMTGLNAYVADVEAALAWLAARHADAAPVLLGHSMGGAVLQHALGVWGKRQKPHLQPHIAIAGLVLLASAPLSGGGLEVARNWQAADAALAKAQASATAPVPALRPGWLPWLRSFFPPNLHIPTGVDTPAQVRNKFFSAEVTEDVVCAWMRDCKSRMESIRVSLETFWPVAEPGPVLAAIAHDKLPFGRKVLCISAEKDVLILGDVSQANFDAYRSLCPGEEDVLRAELVGSGHHIMLDVGRERCANIIIAWLQGKRL